MQTFLPYPSFFRSAQVLDNKRLGKQRVEVLQILKALLQPNVVSGWRNHPATRMWEGYEGALAIYGLTICEEWTRRGFKDTCFDKISELAHVSDTTELPPAPEWYKRPEFHLAHQSNLLRKDPTFYGPKFPYVPDDLPYWWPANSLMPPQEIRQAMSTRVEVDGSWMQVLVHHA